MSPDAPAAPDVIVYADGASRKNPGPAAIGAFVVSADGSTLEAVGERIGDATNNEAEYRAVLKGLEVAARHTRGVVEVRSDSEVLVRQLNGKYRTNKPQLVELQGKVRAAQAPFAEVRYRWVPRGEAGASRADGLANGALDAAGHPKSLWRGPAGR